MRFKTTVTIGVPAFNEEKNIYVLLNILLKQKQTSFRLNKIFVASDGSIDKTNDIVKNFNDGRVCLLFNPIRQGKSEMLNQIIKVTNTNILVLLDADILPYDNNFIENLIYPINKQSVDLTSARLKTISASSFLEKIIEHGTAIKNDIFENINNGDNIYTCHGRARAFSKKLYKSIVFKESVGEDAYSFLFCQQSGCTYKYNKNAIALHKSPSRLFDFIEQNKRFLFSQTLFVNTFSRDIVIGSYYLPAKDVANSLLKSFTSHPFLTFSYFFILATAFMAGFFMKINTKTWEISQSTKLIYGSKKII